MPSIFKKLANINLHDKIFLENNLSQLIFFLVLFLLYFFPISIGVPPKAVVDNKHSLFVSLSWAINKLENQQVGLNRYLPQAGHIYLA